MNSLHHSPNSTGTIITDRRGQEFLIKEYYSGNTVSASHSANLKVYAPTIQVVLDLIMVSLMIFQLYDGAKVICIL